MANKVHLLFIEWNLIRLGGPVRGIVTKPVHKSLPGMYGVYEVYGVWDPQPF